MTVIEVSPHPVLLPAVQDTADQRGDGTVAAVGTLRRDDGSLARVITSAAHAWVRGVRVDWAAVLGGTARGGWSCRRTRSSGSGSGPLPLPAGASGRGPGGLGDGDEAEARFWAAVEEGDLRGAGRAPLAIDDQRLAARCCPALASWRRRVSRTLGGRGLALPGSVDAGARSAETGAAGRRLAVAVLSRAGQARTGGRRAWRALGADAALEDSGTGPAPAGSQVDRLRPDRPVPAELIRPGRSAGRGRGGSFAGVVSLPVALASPDGSRRAVAGDRWRWCRRLADAGVGAPVCGW